jgi:hypothetical protein
MTDDDGNQDEDDAWAGVAMFLWPIRAYEQLKVWIHNHLHPDDPEAL